MRRGPQGHTDECWSREFVKGKWYATGRPCTCRHLGLLRACGNRAVTIWDDGSVVVSRTDEEFDALSSYGQADKP